MEESCSSTMDISILTDFLLATNCNLDDFLGGGVLRDCWDSSQGADELDVSRTQHDANTYQSLFYLFSFSMSMIDITASILQVDKQRTGHKHDIEA